MNFLCEGKNIEVLLWKGDGAGRIGGTVERVEGVGGRVVCRYRSGIVQGTELDEVVGQWRVWREWGVVLNVDVDQV